MDSLRMGDPWRQKRMKFLINLAAGILGVLVLRGEPNIARMDRFDESRKPRN